MTEEQTIEQRWNDDENETNKRWKMNVVWKLIELKQLPP